MDIGQFIFIFCIFKQIARIQGISQNQLVHIYLLSGPAAEEGGAISMLEAPFFLLKQSMTLDTAERSPGAPPRKAVHAYCRAQVFTQKELFFPEVYALSSRGITILYNPCHGGAVAR